MDLLSLASMGAHYLLQSIKKSKVVDDAKEKALSTFFEWTKEKLFQNNKKIEEIASSSNDDDAKLALQQELLSTLQKSDLANEYEKQVINLSNIFTGEIDEVTGNVHIGDKLRTNPITANRPGIRSVFSGKIGKIGGDFHLGNKEE